MTVQQGFVSDDYPSGRTPGSPLGAHLLATGKLSPASLERVEKLSTESGERFELVLTGLGLISESDLAAVLASTLGLPLVSAADFPREPLFIDRLNPLFLRQSRLIPLENRSDLVVVAMGNPLDGLATESVRFALGKPLSPCVATLTDLDAALERLYGTGGSDIAGLVAAAGDHHAETEGDDADRLQDLASEAPVIRLVNLLIARAVEARASDVHFEPLDGELRVRYRIDGLLHDVEPPPPRLRSAVVSRLKVMAKLNIAERRLPQDGRMRLAVQGKEIDFRVSTTPTIHGESIVLRVLDRSSLSLDFAALGFDDTALGRYRKILAQPHGIVLVTGPTGSGKTTTLYTSLQELNTPDKKVLTIEDPVEYQMKGINQVQVKPQIGQTFAGALRSFLRQDPDIMMIGEIRDRETAQIAVQAALTGHLILSTLHTNDAAGAITRLLDMPMTSRSVYSRDHSATYPQQDLIGPVSLVQSVTASNGAGGSYTSTYQYAGAKFDLTGRGLLGFRQMTVSDTQTGIQQTSLFRQDFPFIGLVASTSKTLNGLTLNQTVNSYAQNSYDYNSSAACRTGGAAPYVPLLTQTQDSSTDLDGTALPTITTSYRYDDCGNPTWVAVQTPDGASKQTGNAYINDTANWYLGRLTSTTATNYVP